MIFKRGAEKGNAIFHPYMAGKCHRRGWTHAVVQSRVQR